MMQVAAALLDRSLDLRVGTRELPAVGEGEARIRVAYVGVCGSDLHVIRTGDWVTEWPATLGHEIYGRVEESRGEGSLAPGTAIIADSRIPCGTCETCRTTPNACPNIRFVGEACPGGFATHCILPTALLHAVPVALDGATAVLAEPLAVVLHALSHLTREAKRVAILGHGPIGALIHIELQRRFPGLQVDVAEPAPVRAALSRSLGATTVADAVDLPGGAYDVVFDAAGYRSSLTHAVGLGTVGAHVLLLALSGAPVSVTPMELVERRLRITGSNAFIDELPAAIALLGSDGARYAPIVTDTITLDQLPATIRRQLDQPDAVKVLVRP
jgi:threonine dehydrogenase-like Zn-dependent dehydrogenase